MNGEYSVCISFADIVFGFVFPEKINLPDEFKAFLCDDTDKVSEKITVRLLERPLERRGEIIETQEKTVYRQEDGFLHIYTALTAKDGCEVAFFCADNRENILYYPASMWSFYSSPFRCLHLICGERLLLRNNAFLLHSSVVEYNGRCLLFCGPSGIGKSTQAALWQKHCGACIVNGDRCVVSKKDGGFYGAGSFWNGTSGICSKVCRPIEAVLLLEKSAENSLCRAGADAFARLFANTTVNSHDRAFMEKIADLIAEFYAEVPVYKFACRPDESAVKAVLDGVCRREVKSRG